MLTTNFTLNMKHVLYIIHLSIKQKLFSLEISSYQNFYFLFLSHLSRIQSIYNTKNIKETYQIIVRALNNVMIMEWNLK